MMIESIRVWCALVLMTVLSVATASAQSSTLAWDHDLASNTLGFAVILDGVRTDYGLSPVSGNVCGCSIPLPFAGGVHTVVVTAYNEFGETPSAELDLSPSAVAGGPYLGAPGVPITVDASGSSAPTGFIAQYHWHWADDTPDTLTPTAVASHTFNSEGTFTVTLTVADNTGASASTTAIVALAAAGAPDPPPDGGTPPGAEHAAVRQILVPVRRGR